MAIDDVREPIQINRKHKRIPMSENSNDKKWKTLFALFHFKLSENLLTTIKYMH